MLVQFSPRYGVRTALNNVPSMLASSALCAETAANSTWNGRGTARVFA